TFNWTVWAVAATGFFTDSYNLYATNVILPALAYVYWPNESSGHATAINCVTLAGSIVGQLSFGYLADKFGRQKLYGIELIIVIVSTLGIAQSSSGVDGSLSITSWLMAYRFFLGCGIGAEYPISSVITAEWAPRKSRARMLASVFIMQPIGQFVAALVGLFVLIGLDNSEGLRGSIDDAHTRHVMDSWWRYVTGVGTIPTVIALIFRLTIPESGRWTIDVQNDPARAAKVTESQYPLVEEDEEMQEMTDDNDSLNEDETLPEPFSRADIKQYFIKEGNWRYLAGTSLCWFLLDFAFYGLGLDNPRTLAKLWESAPQPIPEGGVPSWASDASEAEEGIYATIRGNAKRSLLTVSIGAICGCLLLIKLIDYVPRKKMLSWSFVWLALLLAGTGASFLNTFQTNLYGLTIALYVLCQFSFNLGANSLTFIIPAEIFPTRYRCTCHGIAAASGKLGSVIVQATIPAISFKGVKIRDPSSNGLGWLLIIFSVVMLLGCIPAWAWLPELQNMREGKSLKLPSKTLEELAEGVVRAGADGQDI
ncbi:MFS general substrate transporter, partial [Aulographum hederae CBS 113979]